MELLNYINISIDILSTLKVNEIMEKLRDNPPKKFDVYNVEKIRDYKKGIILDINTGKVEDTKLPESNVIYFELNNDAWICIRPSGTEPVFRIYAEASSHEKSYKMLNECESFIKKIL